LYGGLSQRVRWGAALRDALTNAIPGPNRAAAAAAGTALHTLPFLFAAFAIDAGLRAVTGGNSAWAVAAGVTVFLYAGIYEAGRQSAKSKDIDDEENSAFKLFAAFAGRRLERRGRCHLVDVRPVCFRAATKTIRRAATQVYPHVGPVRGTQPKWLLPQAFRPVASG
jgi:hypothetical protein